MTVGHFSVQSDDTQQRPQGLRTLRKFEIRKERCVACGQWVVGDGWKGVYESESYEAISSRALRKTRPEVWKGPNLEPHVGPKVS